MRPLETLLRRSLVTSTGDRPRVQPPPARSSHHDAGNTVQHLSPPRNADDHCAGGARLRTNPAHQAHRDGTFLDRNHSGGGRTMSDQQPEDRPGTIMNGHVLTEDGQWVPV
jgi:hypothetical protein